MKAGSPAQVDWEAELGVIIGRARTKHRRASDALSHVFGYTVINDVTARDLQQRHTAMVQGQEPRRLMSDGSGRRHGRRVRRSQEKRITLRVNGVTKQDGAHTSDMIFTVATIIEWLSKGLTLEPGDIIATGTPEGVGMGRTPQEWLQDGDVVETEVEGIGVIRNVIRNA